METSELSPYLKLHGDELLEKLRNGKYRPLVPTAVDRFVQQAISQILIPLYEPQFSDNPKEKPGSGRILARDIGEYLRVRY